MGYLVTACLATVVAAQAALGVPSLMLETDRPVLFAKGGVVTCLRNQGQMTDYKGNPIEIESARGQRLEYLFGGMPNKDGYSLYGPYLVDKNGAVLCRWEQAEEINYATVTDDNIIFTVENKFSTGRENIVYRRPDGSVLYQTGPAEILNSKNAVIGSTPFYNGQALVCNGSQLMTLNTKGETTVLAQWTATPRDVDRQGLLLGSDGQYNIQNIPHRVMDTMADGWYLAINMWTQPLLANAETGQVLMIPQQAEEGWTVLHQRGGFAPTYGFSTRQFESYWDKGALLAHHGTYVCIAVKGETEKDMLVDVKQLQGAQTLGSYIALYDNIYFDNSQYLLCREGQEYFY
ncbi:MAG: hypothetical protein IIV90_01050, partial [Oscillospiraceae bacterium]|nr:hypothetical protein [Oscillospiraceae bacterium]